MRAALLGVLGAALLLACTGEDEGRAGGTTMPLQTTTGVAGVGGSAGSTGTGALGGAAGAGTGGAAGQSPTGGADGGIEDPGTMSSDARLYTTDGTEFLIDEVGDALVHAASTGPVDNLIYYVHGRACAGGEPAKSLASFMPEMEADYGARVVMFVWPGADDGCPWSFPQNQARASGAAFAHTLRRLAYFRAQNADALSGHRLTLITHSMGNLVLEQSVVEDDSPVPSNLFDTVMLNAAATARDDHHSWLCQVTYAPHVYVSGNEYDQMLMTASVIVGPRLGQNVDGTPLASNAIYVDFSAAAVDHDYFVHSGQFSSHITGFYDTVMDGLPFDFDSGEGIAFVESRDGTHRYVFDGD